jgi:hypothetical protein
LSRPSQDKPELVFASALGIYICGFYSDKRDVLKSFVLWMQRKFGFTSVTMPDEFRELGMVFNSVPSDYEIESFYRGYEARTGF